MSRRSSRLLALVAVGFGAVLLPATPAAADVIEGPGECFASGTWQEGGFTEVSTDHVPDDVIKIPKSDTVVWEGGLGGFDTTNNQGPPREVKGEVRAELPVGSIPIDDGWGPNQSTRYANNGEEDYDVPSLLVGIKIKLAGEHFEDGVLTCSGSVYLQVEGSALSNPIGIAAIILSALALLLIFLSGRPVVAKAGKRGRPVLGAFAGLLLGIGLALVSLVFGVLALDSILLLVLPVVFLIVGILVGFLAPFGSKTPPAGPGLGARTDRPEPPVPAAAAAAPAPTAPAPPPPPPPGNPAPPPP